jgi:hypothetical protein
MTTTRPPISSSGTDYTFYLDPFGDINGTGRVEDNRIRVISDIVLLKSSAESGGVYFVTTISTVLKYLHLTPKIRSAMRHSSLATTNRTRTRRAGQMPDRERRLTVTGMAAEFTDDITNGTAQIGVDGSDTVSADDGTYFYFYSTSDGALKSYYGIERVPTVDGDLTDAYYLVYNSGVAACVLIITEDPVTADSVPPPAHIVAEGYVYYDADMHHGVFMDGSTITYVYSVYRLDGRSGFNSDG